MQLPLPIEGAIVEIPLTQGKVAIVDAIDGDLSAFKWYAVSPYNTSYARREMIRAKRKTYIFIHRVIVERVLGRPLLKDEITDHINGDGLDNRRSNLRVATQAENMRNTRLRSDSTSGYKGVIWFKRTKRWRAQIKINGKCTYLGYFTNPEDAHEAYKKAAIEAFGEFARFK